MRAAIVSICFVLFRLCTPAFAQQSCDQGIVRLPGGVNGKLTVCPAIAAQLPGLQNQLAAVLKAQSDQQGQIRELTRLLKNLNSVGRNIGEPRQAQLLQNVALRLTGGQADGSAKTQEEISELADRLENLKDVMLDKLGNQATSQRATTAVAGPVGDAIAHLDLDKANAMLEGIHEQLNAIGSEVGAVHQQTTEIQNTLQQQQAAEARREQLAQEQAKEAEARNENDPNMFAAMRLMGVYDHLYVFVGSGGISTHVPSDVPTPFKDPTLRLVFHDFNGQARLVKVTDRSVATTETWQYRTAAVGDKVTVCFAAQDPKKNVRRQVTESFSVQVEEDGKRTNFLPIGDPVLSAADEKVCDGVSEQNSDNNIAAGAPLAAATASAAVSSGQVVGHRAMTDDPHSFLHLRIQAHRRFGATSWDVVMIGSGHSLTGAKLQMLVSQGSRTALVDVPVPPVVDGVMQSRTVSLTALPNSAVVCFTAIPSGSSSKLLWRQAFEVLAGATDVMLQFQPSSLPTLTLDTGQPCH